MEKYDRQMADRVWQRVRSTGEQEPLELQGMIQEEMAAVVAYRQLARQLGGRDGEVLQRLAREAQNRVDCLRGIHKLATGENVAMKLPRPVQERPNLLLRKCYAGILKRIAAYEALSGHREYGPAFGSMSGQERENSRILLVLLGRMEK